MRFVQIGFGILIVGGLTALGCGDDGTAAAPPASGGKGGGAGTGATAGTGGATAGKGGSAGAATGGTGGATGGTGGATGGSAGAATGGSAGAATGGSAGAATGGSAGMPGGGGEGGGTPGEACPATQPTDGDDCDNDVNPGGGDDPCSYGTTEVTTCTCGGFQMPTWNCQTLSCPTAEPTTGDMCDADMNPGGGDDPCVYDMNECTCAGGGGGGDPEWECTAPAMCPATAPTDGDMCDTDTDPGAMDGGCVFDTTTCVCAGGMGGGGMQAWNCGTCPATAPADEDACDSDVNAFCAYDSGNCTCTMMDEWNCP